MKRTMRNPLDVPIEDVQPKLDLKINQLLIYNCMERRLFVKAIKFDQIRARVYVLICT